MTKLFKTPPKTGPAHVTAEAKQTLSKHARQVMGKYVERQKLPGEVEAAKDDIFKRKTYKVGDGDNGTYVPLHGSLVAHVPRPGSLRAFILPSRGMST